MGKTLVQSVIMASMIKLAKTFTALQQQLEAKASCWKRPESHG